MTAMTAVSIALAILIVLLASCMGCVAYLRRKPGLRRRREDPNYDGPPRRFTDHGSEVHEAFGDVFAPDKSANGDEERDMMEQSKRNKGGT